jgi:excisionase family DNA binding protein
MTTRPAGSPGDLPEWVPSSAEPLIEAVAKRVAEKLAGRESVADPWLDVDEAADYLRCSRQRIYDLVSEGRLRVAKDGRRSLFRRAWLDACLTGSEGSK